MPFFKKTKRRIILKVDGVKAYLFNILLIIGLSLINAFGHGTLQFVSGLFISILIGCSVTKHHYLFVFAESALVIAVTTAIYALFGSAEAVMAGLTASVMLVLLGIGLGLSTNMKMSTGETVIMCSLIYLANTMIGFAVIGENLFDKTMFEELRVAMAQMIQTQYSTVPEIVALAEEMVSETLGLLYRFLPSMLVCSAGLNGIILAFLYKRLLPKFNINVKLESFSLLRAERSLGVLFIITIMIALSVNDALYVDAFLNLIVILCFMFFICGLSYLYYSMRKKNKSKTYATIMVIVVLPLVTVLFAVPFIVIAGFGLVDSLVDFRKRRTLKGDGNGLQ